MTPDQAESSREAPNPAPEGIPADAEPSGFIVSTDFVSEVDVAAFKARLRGQINDAFEIPASLRDKWAFIRSAVGHDGDDDPRPQEV